MINLCKPNKVSNLRMTNLKVLNSNSKVLNHRITYLCESNSTSKVFNHRVTNF